MIKLVNVGLIVGVNCIINFVSFIVNLWCFLENNVNNVNCINGMSIFVLIVWIICVIMSMLKLGVIVVMIDFIRNDFIVFKYSGFVFILFIK